MSEQESPESQEQLDRDTSYSPSSEREQEVRQDEPRSSAALDDDEIDASAVKTLPGTGGPDDVGEVEVDKDDLNLPFSPS